MISIQGVVLLWFSLLINFRGSKALVQWRVTPRRVHPSVTHWALAHSSTNSDTGGSASTTNVVALVECAGDAFSIQEAATFLVDAFWLGSGRHMMPPQDEIGPVSDAVRSSLLQDQGDDLLDKFGERMGQRLLEAGILLAKGSSNEILGMICLTETLLEQNDVDDVNVWQASDAERLLKDTVASLGPAQRRQYKGAGAQELANELLLPSQTSICCLSNLAVSPSARRSGVARQLCEACEQVARDSWGYHELHLLVESSNTAARQLYEGKLGYEQRNTLQSATALRVSIESGGFVETQAETMVLVKKLQ